MSDDDPLTLFGEATARNTAWPIQVFAGPAPEESPSPRERFLTGLLATWAAHDRQPGAKPNAEETRRAGEGARAALGEIRR